MAELTELKDENNCTWTWIENYNDTGINGFEVKSKKTDGVLFLPAAGNHWRDGIDHAGSRGYYWSSELRSGSAHYARFLYFTSRPFSSSSYRCTGFSVRAVVASTE